MKKYPEVVKYTKQLFVQKISSIVQWQTVPFLTYAFASLQMVAYYGNYTIITDKLAQFVNTFLESTGAGVGNLIAEGNKDNIKKVFWELISIRYFIGGVISFAIYMLINPFIALWLGDKYILDDIRMWEGQPKRCCQAHDSTANSAWTPAVASLWSPFHATSRETALPWIKPTGAHDMYKANELIVT